MPSDPQKLSDVVLKEVDAFKYKDRKLMMKKGLLNKESFALL